MNCFVSLKMKPTEDFWKEYHALGELKPTTPSARVIIEEHQRIDGAFIELMKSFKKSRNNQEDLYKIMVRVKRVRDAFYKNKTDCTELVQDEGLTQNIMLISACVDVSLGYIHKMQDKYQSLQMKHYNRRNQKKSTYSGRQMKPDIFVKFNPYN